MMKKEENVLDAHELAVQMSIISSYATSAKALDTKTTLVSKFADRRPQTADRRPQTADRRPQTA